MSFQKGKLYMLRNLSKNTRWNAMTIIGDSLYLAEARNRSGAGCFQDGDVFMCLEDSPDFDVEAFRAGLPRNITEYQQLRRTADAKGAYDQHRTVSFLAPTGQKVSMRVKGNKTKFKKITSRTRVK